MFGFLKKKKTSFPAIDKIWMNADAKYRAMVSLTNADPNVVFIHWFEESFNRLQTYLGTNNGSPFLYMVREAIHAPLAGKRLIFAEHHPLIEKEKQVFENLKIDKAEIWSSLDEPLLKKFGGERLVGMMERMGMKTDEIIEHPLISTSIRKAQQKIAKKLVVEHHASSQEEWFRKNLS